MHGDPPEDKAIAKIINGETEGSFYRIAVRDQSLPRPGYLNIGGGAIRSVGHFPESRHPRRPQ